MGPRFLHIIFVFLILTKAVPSSVAPARQDCDIGAKAVADCLNVEAALSDDDDSQPSDGRSISLLQRTAVYKVRSKLGQTIDEQLLPKHSFPIDFNLFGDDNAPGTFREINFKTRVSALLYKMWKEVFVKGEVNPWPSKKVPRSDQHLAVIWGPWVFQLCEGIIVSFGLIILCVFFVTERIAAPRRRSSVVVGRAIDSEAFLEAEQQILQDFIIESQKPFVITLDDRKPLTYARFSQFVKSKDADLTRFGVTPNDRLAVVLGSGAEMAVAFWAFSGQCAVAPIDDKSSLEEMEFMLRDLSAKAVVMRHKDRDDRNECAGVPIIEFIPHDTIAGLFTLQGPPGLEKQEEVMQETCHQCGGAVFVSTARFCCFCGAKRAGLSIEDPEHAGVESESRVQNMFSCEDKKVRINRSSVALIMFTAGTTRKPKLVPLTHENLILSCASIAKLIELHPDDRALNIQPLHHIGGLSNHVIAPVLAHASVVCAPFFTTGSQVFEWIVKYRPTWFYASPTNHILIMQGQDPPEPPVCRCVRSASSALLPPVAHSMREFWGCEILPGYGMTECTPIASHQLGKLVRFSSVGPSAAPKVMIDEHAEILVQGPSVFSGYVAQKHMEEDPNTVHFRDGWFRTGDHGCIDECGYLTITGRSKEIILRAGENISPIEVEEALSDTSVCEKAAFSVTHEEYGEVVGLAVVTETLDEELFAMFSAMKRASALHQSQMPECIVKVPALPRTAAGKVNRIGMQVELGLPSRSLARPNVTVYVFDGSRLVELEELKQNKDEKGLMRGQGGVTVTEADTQLIMAVYAALGYMVTCFQAQLFLRLPQAEWGPGPAHTFTLFLGGNIAGGMLWTLQAALACTSYLLCKEPFHFARLMCLVSWYILFAWPMSTLSCWVAYSISEQPKGSFFVLTSKRWYLLVMIFSYALFGIARKLPYRGAQCCILVLSTVALCIWPPDPNTLSAVSPKWAKHFDFVPTQFSAGFYVCSACISTYFIVGYYGHEIVARVKAHPAASNAKLQRRIKIISPVVFLGALLLIFTGSGAIRAIEYDQADRAWVWNPLTLLLDQLVGFVMMALLTQAVRFIGPWLSVVGKCFLGIYLGCNIVYFCPHPYSTENASFGINIAGVWILPTLQTAVESCYWFWPFQTLIIAVYSCIQIAIFGLPFYYLFSKSLAAMDRSFTKLDIFIRRRFGQQPALEDDAASTTEKIEHGSPRHSQR